MKIKINLDNFNFDNFKYYLVNEFPRVRFWEISNNRLLAEKNKFTGCFIFTNRKNITVISGFPNVQTNIIAVILTILGGFIIPIALYLIILKKHHKSFEQQIGEVIAKKYSKFMLINKTANSL